MQAACGFGDEIRRLFYGVSMSIKHWEEGERPREKLLQRGAEALSDAELLAILLRVGTQGMSAVDLARSLLQNYGGLGGVMTASVQDLSRQKGMGTAAFAQFAAVLEIGRRVLSEEMQEQPAFHSPNQVADYLRLRIGRERVEVSVALFLDTQHRLIACEELARGTVMANHVYVAEVARRALHHHAVSVVFAHNHPSGSLQPSPEDLAFTHKLQAALHWLDLRLLDHFIVTAYGAVSFAEQKWLTEIED